MFHLYTTGDNSYQLKASYPSLVTAYISGISVHFLKMQNKYEEDFEHAEYLLEAAKQIPYTLIDSDPKKQNPKGKSLNQKLLELYVEETGKQPLGKSLIYGSKILQKLVKRDKLHCVVLNLYPANEGYSLLLRGKNGVETETIKLPYEESELLEYIDASELPPVLVDLLDKARINVFYSGCVIVEVRDYRRSASGNIDSVYVLLRPTAQSLLADINAITSDGRKWSQDDQYQLESQLLLETEEPLCLDPSPAVFYITNKLQYERKKFNTPLLLRKVKKYSQASVNRKRKFAHGPSPKELKLYDFLHRKKDKRQQPPVNLKVGKSQVDMWRQRPVQLTIPESVETERYAKAMEKTKPTSDNIPVFVEEHVLEKESNQGNCVCYKITVYVRPSDDCYIGEFYMDHDYMEGQNRGSSCRFSLGTWDNVEKYIRELTEFFTERGRLSAKITRSVPGQPPQVRSIQPHSGFSSTNQNATSTAASTTSTQGETSVNSTASGHKKIKPLPSPIQSHSNLVSPQTTPTLPSPVGFTTTTQLPNQMTINIQHPSQPAVNQSQTSRHRHNSRPIKSPSPVSSTSSSPAQLPSYSQAIAGQPLSYKPPTTPTPPPLIKTGSTRRTSVTDSFSTTIGNTLGSKGNIPSPSLTSLGQPNVAPNVNIANIPALSNINLQNLTSLQGVNLASLTGLQNMQVSLTGGGIAVPINMINSSQSIIQNPAGIIVTSLPNQTSTSTSSVTTTSQVTSPTAYVTMVTAMPASSGTSTMTSTATSTAANSGVLTNPTSVLAGPQHGMLQVPVNMAGNFSQLMPHLKTTTVRGHPGLPIIQLPGLFNLQQQQRLQAHMNQSAVSAGQGSGVTNSSSPVSTGVLGGHGLSGQTVTSLPVGKGGEAPQQFLQLTPAQPGTFQPQLQQISTQFQFHTMPAQKPTPQSSSKSKSKKQSTPTPPKY